MLQIYLWFRFWSHSRNLPAAGNTGACIGNAILATDWSVVVRADAVWIPVIIAVITSVHRFLSAAPSVNDDDTSENTRKILLYRFLHALKKTPHVVSGK